MTDRRLILFCHLDLLGVHEEAFRRWSAPAAIHAEIAPRMSAMCVTLVSDAKRGYVTVLRSGDFGTAAATAPEEYPIWVTVPSQAPTLQTAPEVTPPTRPV
jgi:hypothetical protein